MDLNFKQVRSYSDRMCGYELMRWLKENGWNARITEMFDDTDIDFQTILKCWTSILYKLPVVIVTNHDKSHKDMEILDNFREIDSLMRIYGARACSEIYFDPRSCELAIEFNNGLFFPLKDIYDTFKMTERQEEVKSWDIPEDEKQLLIDNMNVVNSRMQQFYITIRSVDEPEKDSEDVVRSLRKFYVEINR